MNLIGLRNIGEDGRLTLDKINREIRSFCNSNNLEIKIMQTHNENKIVSYMLRNRNKISHIVLSPETWSVGGYLIRDTIKLLCIPLSLIISNYSNSIFKDIECKSYDNDNYTGAYIDALKSLI